MPLDDIEQDEAPRDDKTRQSLNTTNRTNTKRDNVDKDTADKIGNERQDTDGGHKRDTTSGGAVVSSGNKEVKKDPPPEEKTDDDNAISGFIQKLISGTFGDTSGDAKDIPPDEPKNDEYIDEDKDTDETNTGSNRDGEFGADSVKTVDEKKDEVPNPIRLKVKELSWELRPNSKYGAIVKVEWLYRKTSGGDGAVFQSQTSEFDDNGNFIMEIPALSFKRTYNIKEIDIGGLSDIPAQGSAVDWLKKQVIDAKSEKLTALYVGWGFTVETPPVDAPKDENPVTNPQDPEQKFEPKEKSNDSPELAPVQVENSKALTEIKLRELQGKRDGVPASMRVQSYIKPVYGPGNPSVPGGIYAGPTSTGYWAFRSNVNGTANQAASANEYKIVESSITGAVKFGPGKATWNGIVKKAILGVQVNPEKNLKITNYPIIMNAPEVGIPNTAIPYVFENQTEQHRMVTGGIFNKSGWGIGSMEGYSSWAERSHWCGYHAKFCWNHSGYNTGDITLDNPEGAGNATDVYSKRLPKPVTPDSEGTYTSLPMFVNPDTGTMEVDPDLYNMGSPIKGAKDAREHCHLYKFYKQTSYTKKTIQKIPGTKKVNGKLVEVMNEKELKEAFEVLKAKRAISGTKTDAGKSAPMTGDKK